MKVEVIRSSRRRKTVQARKVGDVLRLSIPAHMSEAEEERWIGEMVRRVERQERASRIDLASRAAGLADLYDLPRPASIRWVGNQEWRWGSCTPGDGSVRVSDRLAREPSWVLDYVIVHELAHLLIAGHDRRFWALVQRYPLSERARGFLMARGADEDLTDLGNLTSHRPDPHSRPPHEPGSPTPPSLFDLLQPAGSGSGELR